MYVYIIFVRLKRREIKKILSEMITIRILNTREIVENEKGKLVSKIAPFFTDLERKVEEEIVKELQKSLAERNVIAEISIVREK